jgi:phytoene synthase
LREAGIDPDQWLARPAFGNALGRVIRRLLDTADDLYARAGQGIDRLPRDCRPGIHAARFLYAGIGDEVARQGFDSVTRRAVVPATRKATLVTRALLAAAVGSRDEMLEPLDEARFLIDAVAAAPGPFDARRAEPPWWDLGSRAVWVVELFERLERRQRVALGSSPAEGG